MNKIVISTQPEDQAAKLSALLQRKDVLFYSMPLIRTQTAGPNQTIRQALNDIRTFDRIVFTSRRGVSSFFSLTESLKIPAEHLKQIKFAAIGRATAGEILKNGFDVQYINKGNTSVEFSEYLLDEVAGENEKILLPLGNLAPDFLQKKLSIRAECVRINVYETIKINDPDRQIMNMIEKDHYDLLVFTSPSAFDNLMGLTGYQPDQKQLKILSIGRTTTKHIESRGFKVRITAGKPAVENLAEEIVRSFALPAAI